MAISITEIEMGMGLVLDGQVYRVVEYHHVKPAKGSAFVRVKLRHLKNNKIGQDHFLDLIIIKNACDFKVIL